MDELELIREKFLDLSTGWLSQADWLRSVKRYSEWLRQQKAKATCEPPEERHSIGQPTHAPP
jgi:hypothetical protein